MIEKLDKSLNLICLTLIVFGGLLAFRNPELGKLIVSSAFGAFGGGAIRAAANLNP